MQPLTPPAWPLAMLVSRTPSLGIGEKVQTRGPSPCHSDCAAPFCSRYLQMDLVVTECVPEASQSFVLKCLNHYMQMTKSDRSEALLELADVWPSKRRRWRSVLLKSHMGKVSIPAIPKAAEPAYRSFACSRSHANDGSRSGRIDSLH